MVRSRINIQTMIPSEASTKKSTQSLPATTTSRADLTAADISATNTYSKGDVTNMTLQDILDYKMKAKESEIDREFKQRFPRDNSQPSLNRFVQCAVIVYLLFAHFLAYLVLGQILRSAS